MTMLTPERLAEIREKAKVAQAGRRLFSADAAMEFTIFTLDLIAHIEALEANINEWRAEYKRWTIANSANSMNPKLRPHLEQLQAENERLREALQLAYDGTKERTPDDAGEIFTCIVCYEPWRWPDKPRHADDCPFRALEG